MNFNQKSCNIYKSKTNYIIVTQCITDAWVFMDCDPIFSLPISIDESEFQQRIINSLDSSRSDVPDPLRDELEILGRSNLRKMGFSSYSELYRKTKCCNLNFCDGKYKVTPYELYLEGNPSKGLKHVNNECVEFYEKDEIVRVVKKVLG